VPPIMCGCARWGFFIEMHASQWEVLDPPREGFWLQNNTFQNEERQFMCNSHCQHAYVKILISYTKFFTKHKSNQSIMLRLYSNHFYNEKKIVVNIKGFQEHTW
jgi:hypothetical protein